jgi:23S rRNA-/tRNA-specific pseudouridylate synthase
MLHAWRIQFTHPATKNKMTVEAPLKRDMQEFIKILKK